MSKRQEKISRAAHIKSHTVGTSNEISFSVLDAAKNQLSGEDEKAPRLPRPGGIPLFTLPFGRKKPAKTPTKERGLPLSTGDFASVEDPAPAASISTVAVASLGDGAATTADSPSLTGKTTTTKERPAKKAAPVAAPAKPAAPVVAPAPTPSPEEEIALRKARRRRHRRFAIAVVVVASLALVAVGGTYLYREYQNHNDHVAQLDNALNLITSADETVIELDKLVADPFAEGAGERSAAVLSQLPSARNQLDEAVQLAQSAADNLRSSIDRGAAHQATAAIAARDDLIDNGEQLVEEAQDARTAVTAVEGVWSGILAADALAREAAVLVTDTTTENVQASKDKTNQAIAAFEEARAQLTEAQALYPPADLTPLASYLDKRIESLGYAVASDDAFLARNKEEAAAQNTAYNTADAEAVDMAVKLPINPGDLVTKAYTEKTTSVMGAYSTARLQAGTADAFIRDYLGT